MATKARGCWGASTIGFCGNRVGNPEEIVSLREALASLQYLVKDRGKRFDSALCELDAGDLFLNLDGALGQNTDPPSKAVSLPEDYGKFDLYLPLEMFDGWRIYMVDCSESSRLLVRVPNSKRIYEYRVQLGEVDRVLRQTYDAINEMLDAEIGASPK